MERERKRERERERDRERGNGKSIVDENRKSQVSLYAKSVVRKGKMAEKR